MTIELLTTLYRHNIEMTSAPTGKLIIHAPSQSYQLRGVPSWRLRPGIDDRLIRHFSWHLLASQKRSPPMRGASVVYHRRKLAAAIVGPKEPAVRRANSCTPRRQALSCPGAPFDKPS